jgi:hypothetical protein
MVVHCVKPGNDEDCEGHEKWLNDMNYDQAVSVGCGKIGSQNPLHNAIFHANMYDAFDWFEKNGKNVSIGIENQNDFLTVMNDNNVSHIMPSIRTLNGYEITEHSKKYDITKEWRNFTMDDCAVKGRAKKRGIDY